MHGILGTKNKPQPEISKLSRGTGTEQMAELVQMSSDDFVQLRDTHDGAMHPGLHCENV